MPHFSDQVAISSKKNTYINKYLNDISTFFDNQVYLKGLLFETIGLTEIIMGLMLLYVWSFARSPCVCVVSS